VWCFQVSFAGAVPVLSVGIISVRFIGPSRGKALGALVAVVSVVSGAGPLIGGAITQVLGWRWVVAVPLLAALLVEPVARLAPRHPAVHGPVQRLDWLGAGLVAVAAGGVALLLQSPATGAGTAAAAGFAALAAVGLGGFLLHVRRRPDAFLPRQLVANRSLVLASFAGMTLLAAYFAAMFSLPKILSATQGWDPLPIGLAMLPAAAFGAVVSRTAGGLSARVGRFRLAALLALGSAAGLFVAAGGNARPALLVAGLALAAAGFGGGQVALVDSIPLLVGAGEQGGALGLFNLVFFTGGAVGAAAVGGLSGPLGLPGAMAAVAVLPLAGAAAVLRARRLVLVGAGTA
jgi:MFS family permease